MRRAILVILAALALFFFFSYKLTSIPAGITGDEAAFGYNGSLLSRTLHDENGRKLPIFVLSLGGDWRQPITQYEVAVLFKLFGPSLYNLRISAVIIAVISALLIYFLSRQFIGEIGGVASGVVFSLTPLVMIQSHLGLDNITPIPFVITWLLGLYAFIKSKKNLWLVFAGIALGIGFYSYKSMRIFVPTWMVLSILFLAGDFLKDRSRNNLTKVFRPVAIFTLSILPFFLIIPRLEFLYSGAVLNHQGLYIKNIYDFVYPYLAVFDPSFLFVKGDEIIVHSTGRHGMLLIGTLPLFIAGLIACWKKNFFGKFLIASFFLGPLLFGYIGQVHRASRLMPLIPIYSVISAAGFLAFWKLRSKIALLVLVVIIAINYFDFIKYYWGQYAFDTANLFNCFSCKDDAYKFLKDESDKRKLNPYIDHVLASGEDETRDFVTSIYFDYKLPTWNGERAGAADGSLIMTDNSNVSYLKEIGKFPGYYFYIKE